MLLNLLYCMAAKYRKRIGKVWQFADWTNMPLIRSSEALLASNQITATFMHYDCDIVTEKACLLHIFIEKYLPLHESIFVLQMPTNFQHESIFE